MIAKKQSALLPKVLEHNFKYHPTSLEQKPEGGGSLRSTMTKAFHK